MTDEKDASTFYRFNESLWFQHQREIDAFAFRDVETTDCKESPACRRIREKFARNGRWQNDKTWIGCAHELSSATLFQRREKTFERGSENTRPDLAPGTRPQQIACSAAKTRETLERADTRGKTAPPLAEPRGQLRSTHTQLRPRWLRTGSGGFQLAAP